LSKRRKEREGKDNNPNNSGCSNVTEFQSLEANKKIKIIKKIHSKGISISQLNRLTGISKKTIELAIET
jgi:hypothetical protein